MKRNKNLDYLKIIAILAVIMTHVDVAGLLKVEFFSKSWIMAVIINNVCRFCVPVFFMITGAILYSKKDYNPINNVKRFITAFIFWELIYRLTNIPYQYYLGVPVSTLGDVLKDIFKGNTKYHLYFIYIITLIYITSPIVKSIIHKLTKREFENILLFWLIVNTVLPCIFWIYPFSLHYSNIRSLTWNNMYAPIGYAMLGYYINTYKEQFNLEKGKKFLIRGWVGMVVFALGLSYLKAEPVNVTIESTNLFLLLSSMGIFIIGLNYKFEENEKLQNLINKCKIDITKLSNNVFGIYLSHVIFVDFFDRMDLTYMSALPILKPIVLVIQVVITFILSNLICKIIRKTSIADYVL